MEVRGFKTAAVAAGIKASAVLDLALIYSDTPATAAAVFSSKMVTGIRTFRTTTLSARSRATRCRWCYL